jgi:hypothetical protein
MSSIRQNISKRVLRRRFKSVVREKGIQSFDSAKSAVIIFDTLLPDGFPPVKEFTKFLKKQGIKTTVYGYVMQKETPQEMLLWTNFEFITRKDVNWFGNIKGAIAEAYYSHEPDMLFVISFKENLTIEYLTRLSRAKFKIGCFTEKENDLDLMINPVKNECEVGYIIEQIKHYVNMLNSSR